MKLVQVNSNEYWLQISLSNSVLFPLGSVQPRDDAMPILAQVATLLEDFNNPIQVEGYTDNVPVSSLQYPSNWELSSARAVSIVKILVDEGIDPIRLAAVGYGEHQPIAENETPEGREQNRRVVLMIAREKIQRPRVSTQAAISEALTPTVVEETQVKPQPGLEQDSLSESDLTAREKMDRLIETNPGVGIESTLQLEDKPAVQEVPREESPDGKIKPVETKRGGLLFSSDPDLPRNN